MSKVDEIAEIAADGVADGMHVVSEEALAAEKVVRAFDGIRLAYLGLGLAIGSAVGGLIAFNAAYRKAETKFNKIADEEIAEMREHYNQKVLALETSNGKTDLEELVKERGYSSPESSSQPPMAVTPPQAVVEAAEAVTEEEPNVETDPTRLTVDVDEAPEPAVRNVFRDNQPPEDDWDWHKERSRRSPMHPYVIHVDERQEHDAYDDVSFTYFEEDDVLCNERDEVIPTDERNKLIGEENLSKFGHGSGDATIVFIRNDQLEMDFEVMRSPNSYAEEVHGFEPTGPEIRHSYRREGRHFDDE